MKRLSFSIAALVLAACATQNPAPSQTAQVMLPPPRPAPSATMLAAAPQLNPTQSPWLERPGAADYMSVYPTTALQNGTNGSATLECLVEQDYRLACVVRDERPAHVGFGDAALRVSPRFRVAPQLSDGQPTLGGKLMWQIEFNSTGRSEMTGKLPLTH